MSLEAAAKELERLETEIQKRANDQGAGTGKLGGWWEGNGRKTVCTDAQDNGCKSGSHENPGVGAMVGHRKGGSGLSLSMEGRKGLVRERSAAGATAQEAGPALPAGIGHEGSPTRVHLRRTGSVEIERGGHLEFSHTTTAGQENNAGGGRTGGIGESSSSLNHFESSSGGKDAAGEGGGGRWARGPGRWRVAGLDESRSLRSTWTSSAAAAATTAVRGTATGTLARGWRTEADADLSDIKATMRRIDVTGGSGNSGIELAGSAYGSGGTVAFDPAPPASITAAAAPAATATTTAGRFPATSNTTTGIGAGVGMSGLYSSMGEESARALGWGASSGSKAVLSALRALQDKIRKLESERDRAAVEARTLRRQISALQTENDRTAQVNLAGEQEQRLASRLAYERLQSDKNAADIRLRKAEEQNRLLAREAELAKERSQMAEAARCTAEARVSALEDRLLGLGRREGAARTDEVEALEAAKRTRQDKADQIDRLKTRVTRMEASVSAEKSLRAEAESGLARALKAKTQVERFLEGVLRVNEELVKSTVGTPPAASKRVKRKTKRPKAPAAAGPAVTVGGKTAAAPGPCCIGSGGFGFGSGYGGSNGIGGGVGGEFNVGTHTAKRAKTRARKMKQCKRTATAAAAAAAVAAAATAIPRATDLPLAASNRRVLPKATTTRKAANGQGTRSVRSAPSLINGTRGGERGKKEGSSAMPFIGSSKGSDSYNVVSAVSKAMRTARSGKPRESLDALYADMGAAVLDSASDVPFMFNRRQARSGQRLSRRGKAVAMSGRGVVKAATNGRAVLDVAMPDLGGLHLHSESPPHQHHQHQLDANVASDMHTEEGRTRREYWNPQWDEQAQQDTQDTRGVVMHHQAEGEGERLVRNGTGNGRRAFAVARQGFQEGEEEEEDGEGDRGETGGKDDGFVEIGEEITVKGGRCCDNLYEGEEEEEEEEDEDEEEESDDGDRDSGQDEAMSSSGLPITDDSLSSGDEKAWQALGNR